MKTNILIEADIIIRIRKTGEEQKLTVRDIPCLWVWTDGSRDAAEYWAILNWIESTFGNNVDWFTVVYFTGSPVKEGEEV